MMRRARALEAFRHGALPWLAGTSAAALLLSAGTEPAVLARFCGAVSLALVAGGTWSSLALADPVMLMTAWALMLLVMMPPLLAAPLNHLWRASLPRRRARAAALFLGAYALFWLAAGALLLPLGIASRLLFGDWAFAALLLLAIGWSASPLAQRARNKCHRQVRIGLGGRRADADCLRQAAVLAPWCLLSCWPWMLAGLAAGSWHLAAMAAITLLLTAERFLPPAAVRWRLPYAGSARRWVAT